MILQRGKNDTEGEKENTFKSQVLAVMSGWTLQKHAQKGRETGIHIAEGRRWST